MNGNRWKRSATTVYNIGYHLIWCPKYRRKVLVGEVAERLKELLFQKAQEIGVEICSDGGHAGSRASVYENRSHQQPSFYRPPVERLHFQGAEKRVSFSEKPASIAVDALILL